MTIDVTRLIEEVGYAPRTTLETVEEFIEMTGGRHRSVPDQPPPLADEAGEATPRMAAS